MMEPSGIKSWNQKSLINKQAKNKKVRITHPRKMMAVIKAIS